MPPTQILTRPQRMRRKIRQIWGHDNFGHILTMAAGAAILIITGVIFYELFAQSSLSRHAFGLNFLFTKVWDPVAGIFGALPFIYGTVVTSILALLMAVPLGLGSAIFLAELAPPRLSDTLSFLTELLAAVPSVIYGLLGIFVLIPVLHTSIIPLLKNWFGFLPIFGGDFFGVSYLTAGVVLSIMIVPFIVSVSREVLLAVPQDQREASLALGGTHWQTTWRVVVPFAMKGILGSIFLALARALGETMAVTMVIGNNPQIKASLLAPGYSIAAIIANEFTEAVGNLYLSSLIELGLVLFILTIVINGLARLLILATARRASR